MPRILALESREICHFLSSIHPFLPKKSFFVKLTLSFHLLAPNKKNALIPQRKKDVLLNIKNKKAGGHKTAGQARYCRGSQIRTCTVGRWVASLLPRCFQLPETVSAAPGGLQSAEEYGIPYRKCGFKKTPHAHSRFQNRCAFQGKTAANTASPLYTGLYISPT